MKQIRTTIFLTAIFAMIGIFAGTKTYAAGPSPAAWFQQTGFDYDSTSQIYSIDLKWIDGLVDDEHPQADVYYLYRAFIGHETPIDEYELVGTIYSDSKVDGMYYYTDEMEVGAGYFYYLIGFSNDIEGESSPVIQAFSPGSYCVRMDAEIVDFISYPKTVAMRGESYSYKAYAKHRSFRVQGLVRYSIEEGPEGMEIDEKTGELVWDVPVHAEGEYYVKIKAYSLEDDRAESIQQWYIRIANDQEMKLDPTSVIEVSNIEQTDLYPNPAVNEITLNYNAIGKDLTIEIYDLSGTRLDKINMNNIQGNNNIRVPVSHLSTGVYVMKIVDDNTLSTGTFVISR